jgi:hypothetical protein
MINDKFNDHTDEHYITAVTLFNPAKKPKTKHFFSSTLGWMYNRKGGRKGKNSNAWEFF